MGDFSGDWLEDGPNENFAIIKETAYSLFDVIYPFQMGIVNPVSDIFVEEDSDQISMSLLGSVDTPYFFDSDGNCFEAHSSGSDLVTIPSRVIVCMFPLQKILLEMTLFL